MTRRGFTIVELIITITIMGILLTLAVVNVNSTQMNARDDTRKADVEAIASNLEAFYSGGISSASTITNLAKNPRAVAGQGGWFNNNSATWDVTSTSVPANSFGITTGIMSKLKVGQTSTAILSLYNIDTQLDSSTPRSTGVWAYVTASGYEAYFYTPSLGYYGFTAMPANTWTYVRSSAPTTSWATIYMKKADGNGNASSSDTAYVTGAMVVAGSTVYDYADGGTKGWSWSGAVNSSASAGSSIVKDAPGAYPSVSITSSPLINQYLLDANLASFTAPGQTDPYATFIPATNAVQTAAGVLPQPTKDQYVYQPIDSNGALCYSYGCRKYNLYYRTEKDSTVVRVTSKNQ